MTKYARLVLEEVLSFFLREATGAFLIKNPTSTVWFAFVILKKKS